MMLHCVQLYGSRNSENSVLTGRGRFFLLSHIPLLLSPTLHLLCILRYYVCLCVYVLYIIYCIYYTYSQPWCRVLEKLTSLQLVKKFPAFHGTPRFITALTSVRHLSLSWASPMQSIYPHPTSWRSVLILSTHLRLGLPSDLFPFGFPPRPYTPPLLVHTGHMPSPSHPSRFYHPHNIE